MVGWSVGWLVKFAGGVRVWLCVCKSAVSGQKVTGLAPSSAG